MILSTCLLFHKKLVYTTLVLGCRKTQETLVICLRSAKKLFLSYCGKIFVDPLYFGNIHNNSML